LYGSFQWPCAVDGVITLVRQQRFCPIGNHNDNRVFEVDGSALTILPA
jgi:hypothetical protein